VHSSHPNEEELTALVDGELSARRRRQAARHVMHCSECGRLCGQLLATRRVVEQPELDAVFPTGLWPRVRAALDRVDGIGVTLRRPWPARQLVRLPALMAAGLVLILAAVWIRHLALTPNGVDLLLQAHNAATAVGVSAATEVGYGAVGAGHDTQPWRVIGRRNLRLEGAPVEQVVYRVGHLPVSEFTLPARTFHPTEMTCFDSWPLRFYMAVHGNSCIVAWQVYDEWKLMVARTTPAHLLNLARTHTTAPENFYTP